MQRKTLTSVFALSFGIMVSGVSNASDVAVSNWQELNDQLRAGNNAIVQNDMTQWVWGTIGLDTTKNWAGIDGQNNTLTANSSNRTNALQWYDGNSSGGNITLYIKNVIFDGFENTNTASSTGGGTLNIHSNSENNNLTLENVTIKNSKTTASESIYAQGGALRNYVTYGQNLYIKNSLFENNSAIAETDSNAQGGAIYLAFSQYVDNTVTNNTYKIENTTFRGNVSTGEGGAVYLKSEVDSSKNPGIDFIDATFESNRADYYGGAIYNYNNNVIKNITGSTFTQNHAGDKGGAIYNAYAGIIENITGSKFNGNTADIEGGAIYNYSSGIIKNIANTNFNGNTASENGGAIYNAYDGTIESITGSKFIGNKAEGVGGAIFNFNGKINTINAEFESNTAKDNGGAIETSGKIDSITGSTFTDNAADNNGGAIYNYNNGTIKTIENTRFEGNESKTLDGGAIYNTAKIENITGSTFIGNKADSSDGGAIRNFKGSIGTISNSRFENNSANFSGGAISNAYNGTIESITGSIFNGNKATETGGAIFSYKYINTLSASFEGNTASQGGAIYNDQPSRINLVADAADSTDGLFDEVLFKGNVATSGQGSAIYNKGVLNFTGTNNGAFAFYDDIYSAGGVMTFEGDGTGTFNLFNDIKGTGNLIVNSDYVFNMINDTINVIQGDTLTLNSTVKMAVDVDLANAEMDHIDIGAAAGTGSIIVDNMKIFSDSATEKTNVDFINNSANKVSTTVTNANSLKCSYDVSYDAATGQFTFVRNSDRTGSQIAEDIGQNMVTPGIQLLNNSLSMQVMNRDMGSDKNQGLSSGDTTRPTTWAKAFGSKDSVELKNSYNSIDTQFYGVVGGVDSRTFIYDNGVNAVYGIYAAYMGSNQKQNSVKVTQDGGYLGVSADFTKSGIFSRFTAHGGYIANEAKTAWGNDKFDIWTASVSNKTGYEIDFGEYTLKPALYASYMYINTENYTSKAGAKLKNHTKNVFEVTPEVKLAKDFGTGLEGYAKVAYTWNFYQGGKVTADNVLLPKMSVKPYVEYGVGLEKDWSEEEWNPKDITSYAEINRHDGGRTGWDINAGLKFQF